MPRPANAWGQGQLPGTMWVGPNVPEDCPYQFTDRGQPTVISDVATGEPIAVVDNSFSSIAASNTGRWAGSNGSEIYVFEMSDIGVRGDSSASPLRAFVAGIGGPALFHRLFFFLRRGAARRRHRQRER